MTLESPLNGTFLLQLMEKEPVMELEAQWFKRLAAFVSLQKPYTDQIMTPRQLFDWVSTKLISQVYYFGCCTLTEHEAEEKNLSERLSKTRTILRTRKLHAFNPLSKIKVLVKSLSASVTSKKESVSVADGDVALEPISGFVTCAIDGQWWHWCVFKLSVC